MLIYNFDQFILESNGMDMPFHLSESLVYILSLIEDPISEELLHLNRIKDMKDYTIIDTEFNEDYVTFVPSKLLRTNVYSNFDDDAIRRRFAQRPMTPSADAWWKGRSPIKIGRLINHLFPNKFSSSQLEVFINKFKSKNQRIPNRFEMWNSIPRAYDTFNYSNKYGQANQIWNSCMNDAGDDILDFYVQNDQSVECLVLLEDEIDTKTGEVVDKIIGRSLVWRTDKGELFMDRVYFIQDKDYYKFIDFAKENKMIYKSKNQSGEKIEFTKNGVSQWYEIKIDIKYPIETYSSLPYMDTFCFGQDKSLMNYRPKTGSYLRLNGTEGEFEKWEEGEY